MLIFIPTIGRINNQKTLENLPKELQKKTILVTTKEEQGALQDKYREQIAGVWYQPDNVKGIAATRQFILEHSPKNHFCMLDDDMFFQKKDDQRKNKRIIGDAVLPLFNLLQSWLDDGIVHCGVTVRFLNWQHPGPFIEASRMMHILCYNRQSVLDSGCSFTKNVDQDFSMDDFHMTLQLLRAGIKNRISTDYCSDPSGSNTVGGASLWRNLKTQNKSAWALYESHNDFVRVKKKKAIWEGMEGDRYDVVVQWKKAFASSGAEL